MKGSVTALTAMMADHLENVSVPLVERWIDWLGGRFGAPVIEALPRKAIRDHIPQVVTSLAAFIRAPIAGARTEMLGHLELHATLRRNQGYELGELLVEFEGLAQLVSEELRGRLHEAQGEFSAADVVEAYERVATGLRSIGFVTVDSFRDSEIDQRRMLSARLEEFARTIAHEIRTPLQTASLGTTLLRDDEVGGDAAQRDHHLSIIENALGRTAELLDDIRQLALVESGRGRTLRHGRVRSLTETVLEQLAPVARQHEVSLHIEGAIPEVAVDNLAFQVALANIIGNAIKYSDPNKEERTVVVSFRHQPQDDEVNRLAVSVFDNGLGIAPEYLHRVFQRHVRVHPEVAAGTGLGLAITRQVILERGGEIDLSSAPGAGTTVTFELPAYPGAVTETTAVEQPDQLLELAMEQAARDDRAK